MKNLLKLVFMWTLSLMISLWIVYWAWKLITSLNQTAVKWDVITSDWVNAVNTKMSSSGEYVKGGLYWYCIQAFATFHDGELRYNRCQDQGQYKSVYPAICSNSNPYAINWQFNWKCGCENWFRPVALWKEKGASGFQTISEAPVISCMKQ